METRHGEGSFVKTVSPGGSMTALVPDIYLRGGDDSLRQVLEYREIIEVQAVRLAAQRGRADDYDILKKSVEEMEEMVKSNDEKGFAQADMDFHLQIARMTHNSIIIKIHF